MSDSDSVVTLALSPTEAALLMRSFRDLVELLGEEKPSVLPEKPPQSGVLDAVAAGDSSEPIELSESEQTIFSLLAQSAEIDASVPGLEEDAALARLFPDLYPDDPESSADLQTLTRGSLRDERVARFLQVVDQIPAQGGKVKLSEAGVDAWLRALTDLRLVLGARLGLDQDEDLLEEMDRALKDDDPITATRIVIYEYATHLTVMLLDALDSHDPTTELD